MTTKEGPIKIGITGTIGSGKSTVGKILSDLGYPVIDTDKIVHELLATDTTVRKAVAERFGNRIITKHGAIDRSALAHIVFSDVQARKDLEAIVHPAVILEKRKRVAALQSYSLVALLVPLLFEAGLTKEYDEIWTVITSEPILKQRMTERENGDEANWEKRRAAQWSQERKASLSHQVIDNSGDLESTRAQVETLLNKVLKKRA